MVLTASAQKFNVALLINTGFNFLLPPLLFYIFFLLKDFPNKGKIANFFSITFLLYSLFVFLQMLGWHSQKK